MTILYSDRDIAVCIKPVGLDSEAEVPGKLKELLGGEVFPIHRLDKNVGGVMVYARNPDAAAQLSRLIGQGDMVKEYIARVHGDVPPEGDWEDLLFKDSRKNKVFVVKRKRAGVKAARLTFVRLSGGEMSDVQIRLYTGRSHQIRVQFASRGYPLAGDGKYGAKDGIKAPMLYSFRITFPWKGAQMQFTHRPDWL